MKNTYIYIYRKVGLRLRGKTLIVPLHFHWQTKNKRARMCQVSIDYNRAPSCSLLDYGVAVLNEIFYRIYKTAKMGLIKFFDWKILIF